MEDIKIDINPYKIISEYSTLSGEFIEKLIEVDWNNISNSHRLLSDEQNRTECIIEIQMVIQ